MTNMYIDTEFNEFEGDLISMALVAEDGEEFYEVLDCANPGPWVAKHVLPILEKEPVSIKVFTAKLEHFINQYDSINVIADWPDDIKYFCRALITGPGMAMNTPRISLEIRRDLSAGNSKVPHNALWDARAIWESTFKFDTSG